MRRATTILSLLALSGSLLAFAPAPTTDLGASCRIDGVVAHSGAVGHVTCTDVGGDDFDVDVRVTLQTKTSVGWEDEGSERCTGASSDGQASVSCEVFGDATAAVVKRRALVELIAPVELATVELRPTDQGSVIADALADDACGVNEALDTEDATEPDAPWADVCAISLSHGTSGGALSTVTVTVHVAGMLGERVGTTSWRARLDTAACTHLVEASDDGVIGTAGVLVHSECDWLGFGPCDIVMDTLYGDACRAGLGYETSERLVLPDSAIAFTDTEVIVTVPVGALGQRASADLVRGATVQEVNGGSDTGLGSSADGTRARFLTEFASSNGRSYTFG